MLMPTVNNTTEAAKPPAMREATPIRTALRHFGEEVASVLALERKDPSAVNNLSRSIRTSNAGTLDLPLWLEGIVDRVNDVNWKPLKRLLTPVAIGLGVTGAMIWLGLPAAEYVAPFIASSPATTFFVGALARFAVLTGLSGVGSDIPAVGGGSILVFLLVGVGYLTLGTKSRGTSNSSTNLGPDPPDWHHGPSANERQVEYAAQQAKDAYFAEILKPKEP